MKQTPEEMEAAMAVLTAQHNAALADPFKYERAEVERLAELCRTNYAGQVTPPADITGWCCLGAVGWFHGEPGEMVYAVNRFCTALAMAEHAEHIGARILNAKYVGLLLERAQRACGLRTLADTAAGLSGSQQGVIVSLARLKSFDAMPGAARGDVLSKMPGADEDHVKEILRAFAEDGTIESNGKYGRHRRYWLSIRGAALAEYIQAVL